MYESKVDTRLLATVKQLTVPAYSDAMLTWYRDLMQSTNRRQFADEPALAYHKHLRREFGKKGWVKLKTKDKSVALVLGEVRTRLHNLLRDASRT